MDKYNRELIHKLLDGEATPKEKKEFERAVEASPAVREEAQGLLNTIEALEQGARFEAPMGFTANVLRKLPACRPAPFARVRDFLFSPRVLRWNMASVAAAALIIIASIAFVKMYEKPDNLVVSIHENNTPVTVRIEFSAPRARHVALAGDFNRWSADTHRMKREAGGIWSIDIEVEPGAYAYMFVVDGKAWVPDPQADSFRDDGFGEKNSVLRVGI